MNRNLTSEFISDHWRSITVLLAKSGHGFINNVLWLCINSSTKGHFFGMYAHMTSKKLILTTHRDTIFCMYTQISTRSYIGYVTLTINIIIGHCNPHIVTESNTLVYIRSLKICSTFISWLQNPEREYTTCTWWYWWLMDMQKSISMGVSGKLVIRNKNVRTLVKTSFWHVTICGLQLPLMILVVNFIFLMYLLVVIWIYMQKNGFLDGVNVWSLVTSSGFYWPLVTTYDHIKQMYISSVTSSSHMCIHDKQCIPVYCH